MAEGIVWDFQRARRIPAQTDHRLTTSIEGLEGITNVADYILVFGEDATYEETERDQDRGFVALMERSINKNFKLNPDELKFKMTELLFMGHVISDIVMRADPNKVSAVTKIPVPCTKTEVQRFIGMCN